MRQVPLTVWRITTRRFVDQAFPGEGAKRYGGRWNKVGQAVVYTAESRALALLEMRVQDAPLHAHYVLIPASLPASVSMETFSDTSLPKNWRSLASRETLQLLGGQWLMQMRSCVLEVPSAVIPAERNFLINPLHPDFKPIALGLPELLETDLQLR